MDIAEAQGRLIRRIGCWLRVTACAALILCACLMGMGVRAQAQVRSEEYRLKLVFLYNLAKFVEWPADAFPSPKSPLNVCVIGINPFDPRIGAATRGAQHQWTSVPYPNRAGQR